MRVEILENGREVQLIEPIIFDLGGAPVEIPAGFRTDFASSPKIVWAWIPPWGKYSRAAVIHDFLIRNKIVSRGEADDLFLDHLVEAGVSKLKRNVMWAAVRFYSTVLEPIGIWR